MNAEETGNSDPPSGPARLPKYIPLTAYAVCAALAVAITLYSGSRHDYATYLLQWRNGVSEGNPWLDHYMGRAIPANAYGPLQALFAKLLVFGDLAPKLAFTAITLALPMLALLGQGPGLELGSKRFLYAVLLYACTPIFAITIYVFGINDGVVAFFVLAACVLRTRCRYGLAGVAIGLAALLKFYPILFIGFFAIGRNGIIHLRAIIGGVATFGLGMGLAYLHWGDAMLAPFRFGADREPKLLSILYFLDLIKENIAIAPAVDFLVRIDSYLVLAVAMLALLWGWARRQSWEVSALVGILAILLTYKVGHPQFYLSWMSLYYWILLLSRDEKALALARAFVPVAVFLSLFQLLYFTSWIFTGKYMDGPGWLLMRALSPVALLALVIRAVIRNPPPAETSDRTPLRICL